MSQFDTGETKENARPQEDRRDDRKTRDRRDDKRDEEYNPSEETSERINRFFGTGRASFNSISNKLLAQFSEVFESTATEYDNPNIDPALERKNFRIHPLDASSSAAIPTLLICLPVVLGQENVVIHYSLVLEPTGPQRFKTIRGDRDREDLTLPVFVEDHMDDRWRDLISKTAKRLHAGRELSAGYQMIPNNLIDEKSDLIARDVIARIFANAIDAICATREDLLLANGAAVEVQRLSPIFVDENHRFSLSIDHTRTPKRDTSGAPIRSDIAISVFHEEAPVGRGRDGRYDERIPTSHPIGTVSLALDLEYIENAGGAFGGFSSSDDYDQPYFQPVLNITDIVGAPGVPWALESTLLMIGSATLMSDNYRWVETLRNRSGKYPSLEALDALLLAHPDPERRDIADGINSNSSDQELGEYLNKTVAPDLFFGMTLNPAGEKSWAAKVFELIAISDSRDSLAYETILYEACDNLTDNEFSAIMEKNGDTGRAPVRSVDTRVFLGEFIDKDGNERDVREWNPTAVLNFKRGSPRDAIEWMLDYQDTMLPSSSVEMNADLATRYGMLTDILGTSAFTLRGTAECIQLESWFMRTLAEALNKSGMMPHINDNTGLRTRARRSTGFTGERVRDIGRQGRNRRDSDDSGSRRPRR